MKNCTGAGIRGGAGPDRQRVVHRAPKRRGMSAYWRSILLSIFERVWALTDHRLSAQCQAAGHEADGGPPDHGFAGGGVAFVVAGQPPVCAEPRQGPLDRPPAWEYGESLLICGLADDVDGGAQGLGDPADQASGETCGVRTGAGAGRSPAPRVLRDRRRLASRAVRPQGLPSPTGSPSTRSRTWCSRPGAWRSVGCAVSRVRTRGSSTAVSSPASRRRP
jgi:hypothetical protein